MRQAAVVISGLAVWFSPALAETENAKLAPEVKKLFRIGWQRSKAAREAAGNQYQRLREMAPTDRRVKYAYVLVQIRQMKYPEASALLDQMLQANDEALVPRQARVWLLMMMKQYDRAMGEMPKLAKRLPKKDGKGEAERPYTEAAGFLGRTCGYLAEPAKGQVNATVLSQCQEQILAQLTPKRRAAFEDARHKVVREFSGATEQTQADAAKAEEAAAHRKQEKVAEMEQRSKVAAGTLASEQASLDKVKKDVQYEMTEINKQEREAIANLQQLQLAIAQLQREVPILDERVRQLLERAEQEQDPLQRQILLDAATRWQLDRNRVIGVITDRQRQHLALNQQRIALIQRRGPLRRRLQQEGGRVERAEKNAKKVQAQHTRAIGETVTGQTAGVRHQKRRLTAFSTYVPLPFSLEAEAKRVLAWFE